MENSLSLPDLSSAGKNILDAYVETITNPVFDGEQNALQVYIKFKKVEYLTKKAIEKLKNNALVEANKYSKGDSRLLGTKFSVSKGSANPQYGYEHIEPYFELLQQRIDFEKQIETINQQMEVVKQCADTGTAYPLTGEILPKPILIGTTVTAETLTITINT